MVLKQGMSGPEVLRVQQRLQELGFFSGTPRGNFGEMTEAAVRAFQETNGLAVDGVVGPSTWGPCLGNRNPRPNRRHPGSFPLGCWRP
jgi:peptidoglycan hydrolase-like protein with peptidoglycan-binding domain